MNISNSIVKFKSFNRPVMLSVCDASRNYYEILRFVTLHSG